MVLILFKERAGEWSNHLPSAPTGNRKIALDYSRDFKREVVAELGWQNWQIGRGQILRWLVRKATGELQELSRSSGKPLQSA